MMFDPNPVKVVIADDHPMVLEGFRSLFKKDKIRKIEIAAEALNGEDLIRAVIKHHPSVVVTDIKMPVLDGIEATKWIHKRYPHIGIIAYTMFEDETFLFEMLEAGAKGYLLKTTLKEETVNAIIAVRNGEQYFCNATSLKLIKKISKSKFNQFKNNNKVSFTTQEEKIIRLMCRQYTSRMIADELNLSTRTIEDHRKNIQAKTGTRNMIGIVLYAIKFGYIKLEEIDPCPDELKD